jgi:hypothetical protein
MIRVVIRVGIGVVVHVDIDVSVMSSKVVLSGPEDAEHNQDARDYG